MLSSSRYGGKCIFCAFRSQQLALQARRSRRHSSHTTSTTVSRDLPSRYYGSKDTERPAKTGRYPVRPTRNDVVRKFGVEQRVFRKLGRQYDSNEIFHETLMKRLAAIKEELKDAPLLDQLRKENQDEGEKTESFNRLWDRFARSLRQPASAALRMPWFGAMEADPGPELQKDILRGLQIAFNERGQGGLDDRIKYAFYAMVTGQRFTPSDIKNQQAIADLRYPSEFFPATRILQRKIHMHVGPTNSGKTYHALKRLEDTKAGIYAGPLRLLAHEVYTRMNAKGIPCALITGEERRFPLDQDDESIGSFQMSACTVEMMPLNKNLEVAVIDEIQMIGNEDRGWAWTQALLGVKANEVHLCGEERAVPIVRELCASVGEEVEIHRYERLSPLMLSDQSLKGSLRNLRKGDCVVSFSVMGIHSLRRQIERATGKKVATVYGSLPPETRAQQARLFNDPNNDYDYLVASDAVGMGLNLAIKRIIFETSSKFDGYQRRALSVADIKQIAGRAGRYRVASQDAEKPTSDQDLVAAKGDSHADEINKLIKERKPTSSQDLAAAKGDNHTDPILTNPQKPSPGAENVGLVTTLEEFDFPIVRQAMSSEPEPIRTAGLWPPAAVLERFAAYFPPRTPFSYILARLHELSQMNSRFHLCGLKDQLWIADVIEPVANLTIADRNIICAAPASKAERELYGKLMPALAKCIAEQSGGSILDIEELPLEVLDAPQEVRPTRDYLRELEALHKGIVTYLWLSYRFAGIFNTRPLAFHVKQLVEDQIEKVLGKFDFTESAFRKIQTKREEAAKLEMAQELERRRVEGLPLEGLFFENGKPRVLTQHQTSLVSGGDRFGGEEDIKFEEEDVQEDIQGQKDPVSSFAAWRQQQTRGESQASKEYDLDTTLSEGLQRGEETGLDSARPGALETNDPALQPEEDTLADFLKLESESQEASNAGKDAMLERCTTPTTASVPEDPVHGKSETVPFQAMSTPTSNGEERPFSSTSTPEPPASENRFGANLPPKHLAHIEVNATELERDVSSRP